MKSFLTVILLLISLFIKAQTDTDYYKKAVDYRDKKDNEHALSEINKALELHASNTDYQLLKGDILYDMGQYQDAYDTYSQLLQLDRDNAIALNQRGLLQRSAREYGGAIEDFDRALKLKNNDSMRLSLLLNRGAVKIDQRNFDGAYSDFMLAYAIDSMSIGVLNNLATVCDEVGKGDLTLVYLNRIISIDSTFIGAYGNIGFKYQEMGQYKKAITYFNKVLKLEPDEPLSYNNRAFCRYKLGDLAGALKDVNKSLVLYPANSFAFKNRALIYIAQKNMTSACGDLNHALDLGFTDMYGFEVSDLLEKYCK